LIIKCKELNKILNSIVKTTKENLKIIDNWHRLIACDKVAKLKK
jgi:hypothetical protein